METLLYLINLQGSIGLKLNVRSDHSLLNQTLHSMIKPLIQAHTVKSRDSAPALSGFVSFFEGAYLRGAYQRRRKIC